MRHHCTAALRRTSTMHSFDAPSGCSGIVHRYNAPLRYQDASSRCIIAMHGYVVSSRCTLTIRHCGAQASLRRTINMHIYNVIGIHHNHASLPSTITMHINDASSGCIIATQHHGKNIIRKHHHDLNLPSTITMQLYEASSRCIKTKHHDGVSLRCTSTTQHQHATSPCETEMQHGDAPQRCINRSQQLRASLSSQHLEPAFGANS